MTDKTDSKERDAFEAHWLREGNPRNSLAKWQDADNVPPKMRGAYVMACTRDAWSAFQAGRASLAASAGSEPVAWRISCPDEPDLGFWLAEEAGGEGFLSEPLYTRTAPPAAGQDARPCHVFTVRKAGPLTEWAPTTMAFALPDGEHALYTHPSPPEGMVGGWQDIATAPKDGTSIIAYRPSSPPHIECMNWCAYEDADIPGAWHWDYDGDAPRENPPTHWMPLPLPPTTSAGSGKGE